jgi:hypothetical protein
MASAQVRDRAIRRLPARGLHSNRGSPKMVDHGDGAVRGLR